MIDVQTETVISLAEAVRLLPARRAGKKVHLSCLYRWSTVGCRGIVLETIQVGATRCTSHQAMQRFFEALTAQARRESPAPAPPSKTRQQAFRQAEQRLARAGI